MTEGNKKLLAVLALLFTVIVILAWELPQHEVIFSTIWAWLVLAVTVIFNFALLVVLALLILVVPWILGAVVKRPGIQAIDPHMSFLARIALGLTSAFAVGLAWILLLMLVMNPWNWIYKLVSMSITGGWQGFETPPVGWGVYAFLAFMFVWTQVEYRTPVQKNQDELAAKRKGVNR